MYHRRGVGRRRGAGPGTWLAVGAALAAIVLLLGVAGRLHAWSTGGDVSVPTAAGQAVGEQSGGADGDSSGGESERGGVRGGGPGGGEPGSGDVAEPEQGEQVGDGTFPLSFSLDLLGEVPYADNFSVSYSIDGRRAVHGFCGFSENNLCRNDRLYTFTVPAVAAGASLQWHLNWGGTSELTFGHGSEPSHVDGKLINYRCVFPPSDTGNPTPTCSPQ
jgi:hypothetical protein